MTQSPTLNNKPLNNSKTNKLPNILSTTNTITYSQRYDHMTKIANYNQMSQSLIWKEYQKLRICLKELNDQVLYHMERKAYSNSKQPPTKQSVTALAVMQQQKRLNYEKLTILTTEFTSFEQRLNLLMSNQNLVEQLSIESENVIAKIKQLKLQNKAFKRKQKLDARNLQNGPTLAQKVMTIDQELLVYQRKCSKNNSILKVVDQKIKQYDERCSELQRAIELRLQQFSHQQNYIAEQINFERFEQLKRQKQNLYKYQPIYKRNYLMKLKQLETLVNSIKKHDQIIQQTESNIMNMRSQIDLISTSFGTNRKRNSSSVMQIDKQKRESKQNVRKVKNQKSHQQIIIAEKGQLNDKNTEEYESMKQTTVKTGGVNLAL